MRKALILLCVAVGCSWALVRAYSVEPKTAAWSGWTRRSHPNDYISQTITCNFDSIVYCELFVGDFSDTGAYKVDVYELPGGTNRVAYNDGENATRPHTWVRMPLTTVSGKSFTKGKIYEFKFTRSGSDSIQYYYSQDNPYPYGSMPGDHAPNNADLAARVYGRNTPLYSLRWGSHVRTLTALMPAKPFGGWGDSSGGPARAACAAEAGIRLDRDYVSMHVLWPDSCPDRTDRTLCFLPALSFPA